MRFFSSFIGYYILKLRVFAIDTEQNILQPTQSIFPSPAKFTNFCWSRIANNDYSFKYLIRPLYIFSILKGWVNLNK